MDIILKLTNFTLPAGFVSELVKKDIIQFSALLYNQAYEIRNRIRLSLAYNIVKAHGGELRVEREEAKGAQFIVSCLLVDTLISFNDV